MQSLFQIVRIILIRHLHVRVVRFCEIHAVPQTGSAHWRMCLRNYSLKLLLLISTLDYL